MVKLTIFAFAFAQMALAAPTTLFVATNLNGDGSSWANATNSIQGAISAIDPSNPTNTVWVSNGVYEVGGVTNFPSGTILTNRVAITNAITVRSANNDPANTVIKGAWNSSVQTNAMGPAAVRCVYMTNGSSLIGFTLSNGATLKITTAGVEEGGGVYCQSTNTVISNCVIVANAAYNGGGGSYYGTLYNCTVSTNVGGCHGGGTRSSTLYDCTLSNNWTAASIGYSSEQYGGGASGGILSNCMIVGNVAQMGGGSLGSRLFNCTLSNNHASWGSAAGGQYSGTILSNCTIVGHLDGTASPLQLCTLYNCMIISNSVGDKGGGANACTLYNCTLIGNSSSGTYGKYGGGAYNCILYNCTIVGNYAQYTGGGVNGGTQYNCTIVGNYAGVSGGGVSTGKMYNCIVYFNDAPAGSNWIGTVSFTNCCTAPSNTGWAVGNITNDPAFVANGSAYGTNHVAGNYRLSINSPCINTGTNGSWTTNYPYDRDSRTRIRYRIVDMGAYEVIRSATVYGFR